MSQEHDDAQPSREGPRWQWALIPAILVGLIGPYVLSYFSLVLLIELGTLTAEYTWTLTPIVLLVTFGGLLIAAVSVVIAAVASWPLGKYAARRWGVLSVLLAGVLAGAIGALLVTATFIWFMTL